MNNIGPRTEPCGTPCMLTLIFTEDVLDETKDKTNCGLDRIYQCH